MTRFTCNRGAHSLASRVSLIAILAIAIAGALSIGVSAAKAALSDCPAGNFCLWLNNSYQGGMIEFNEHAQGSNQWFANPTGNPDWNSMYNNRTNKTLFGDFYANGVGPPPHAQDCTNPGGQRGILSNFTYPGTSEKEPTVFVQKLVGPGTSC